MKVLRILPFFLICLVQITSAQLVWPGDVNNNGIVNEVDLLTLGKAFGAAGPSRGETNLIWQGEEIIEQWEGTFPNGLNYAFDSFALSEYLTLWCAKSQFTEIRF